ncbi:hypothetical protein [Bacillus sp. AG4(2022)]|uniref:hypothetical protein n=1 Tax=Bacillus sp. AG4(2022) TaxID=2962594 RepID=UPI002881BF80|nr:hypothetical protein [Bacillus sp. AG4(2022)]MDT0160363.1 hypothetical protein [Bacillus sp. AG4(2022)]
MKGYFTIDQDKEFCNRVFKAGEKYYIIKETKGHIIVKSENSEEQMMTKLWLQKGMFNFLTFHKEE